tara:strand:- start:418 stop:1314 length:897 start_codon:yes stop_codon:yes gene_type:complete
MTSDKSIVLNLMTEKGFEVLKTVSRFQKLIAFVIIGKDKNIEIDYSDQIKDFCKDNDIDFYYREDHPKIDKTQYILAISWQWMINHPKNKLIIFHDSILPKYRGFSPLVNMLVNGEKEIGVSAIFGSDEYDKGEIISQKSTVISYPIKIFEAIQLNIENYKILASEIFNKISKGQKISSIPQKESDSSYSIWRNDDDYYIDWNKSSYEIKRLIDAVGFPYLGARSKLNDDSEIIIKDAMIYPDVDCELRDIGKVIFIDQGYPIIICGSGLLKITDASFIKTDLSSNFLPIKKFRLRFK